MLDSIDDRDDVRARLPLNVQDDRRSRVHPGGLANIFRVIEDGGNLGQFDGSSVSVGDDEWSVIAAGEQLIGGSNLEGLMRSIEVAFGLIHVGGNDGGAQILQIDTVGRHRRGIRLNPDRRLLPAAYADQADPGQLRNLRRQPGVGKILDLRERKIR